MAEENKDKGPGFIESGNSKKGAVLQFAGCVLIILGMLNAMFTVGIINSKFTFGGDAAHYLLVVFMITVGGAMLAGGVWRSKS